MFAYYGENMTFFERFANTFSLVFAKFFQKGFYTPYNEILEKLYPAEKIDPLAIQSASSLIFLNAEPLMDFPKVTIHKMIDIGGITVLPTKELLNKETIRETFRLFPNVTFIWKYEKTEDDIGRGIDNIVPATFVPQMEMLKDERLSLFITHCGAGSTIESSLAGVPLIVIPIMGDQRRNAQMVKRAGTGIIMEKEQLGSLGPLEAAIREGLSNPSYRESAKRLSAMIAKRPFTMREIFVRNMEFLARFGPLRNWDHYGRHLSFVQYYSLDVIGFAALVTLLTLIVLFYLIKWFMKLSCGFLMKSLNKRKKE